MLRWLRWGLASYRTAETLVTQQRRQLPCPLHNFLIATNSGRHSGFLYLLPRKPTALFSVSCRPRLRIHSCQHALRAGFLYTVLLHPSVSKHFQPGPSEPQGPRPGGIHPTASVPGTQGHAHLSSAFFLATILPLSPYQKQLKHPSQRRHILPNALRPHLPELPT